MKKVKVFKAKPLKVIKEDGRSMMVEANVQFFLAGCIKDCINKFAKIADDNNRDSAKEIMDDLYFQCGRILDSIPIIALCPECGSQLNVYYPEDSEILGISWMFLLQEKLILKKDLEKVDVDKIYDWISRAHIQFDVTCGDCDFVSFPLLIHGKLAGVDTSPRLIH